MKSDSEVEQIIRGYLPQVIHMSLATSSGGKPWVCEVHYVTDDELNIYFRSKPSRRHSKEIANNPNVAGNIVEQHGLADKPRGVYFEGTAERLDKIDEASPIYKLFKGRFGVGSEILEDAQQDDGHKFYKITVGSFYLFDSRESSPSQKYALVWKS